MLNVECVRRYWHKRGLHFSDRPSSCRDSNGFLRKWMLWCCFLPIFVSSCLLVFSFFFFSIFFLSLLVQGFKWRSPHVCVVIMCALSSCVCCDSSSSYWCDWGRDWRGEGLARDSVRDAIVGKCGTTSISSARYPTLRGDHTVRDYCVFWRTQACVCVPLAQEIVSVHIISILRFVWVYF